MHSYDPPYAHNDVKPGNVLLTNRKGQPPLAILMDFGSTRPARREIRSRSEALQLQVQPNSSEDMLVLLDIMTFEFQMLTLNDLSGKFCFQINILYYITLCSLYF